MIFKEKSSAFHEFKDKYGKTPLEYAIKNFYTKYTNMQIIQEIEEKVNEVKRDMFFNFLR